MWSIVIDSIAWSVGLSVTLLSPAKTAEPMETPFGLSVRTGPRNHKLDEPGPDPPWEGAILGEGAPIVKYRSFCREMCKNGWTDQFAIWVVNSDGPKKAQVQSYSPGGANVPHGRAYWCHLANMIEPSICGSDAVLCQTTLTTCSLYNWHMAYSELHNNTVLSTNSQTHCIIS